MKRFPSPPESRVYRHSACGTETGVSGGDFFDLCNPFQQVASTFCTGCKATVPLDEVIWADTGEDLASYRNRLLKSVPTLFRWADSKWAIVGCLAFAALGAWIAMSLFPGNDLAWKIPGIAALVFGGGLPFLSNIWIFFVKYTEVM
jgi:hypothetical protein